MAMGGKQTAPPSPVPADLFDFIDEQRNPGSVHHADEDEWPRPPPKKRNSLVLSLREDLNLTTPPLTPETPSFSDTAAQQSTKSHTAKSSKPCYRPIGFGQCGLVFERVGKGHVIKVAKKSYCDSLWNDFTCHYRVRAAFDKYQPACGVPILMSYVTDGKDDEEWWEEQTPLFPQCCKEFRLPSMGIISERILPLPEDMRTSLINRYCPEFLRDAAKDCRANKDCLARVYLGRWRSSNKEQARFSLRNYNLCLDQMLELNLPVEEYAKSMGEALAIIHWEAQLDAYNVKFVLGSENYHAEQSKDLCRSIPLSKEALSSMKPHTSIRALQNASASENELKLWVLDFNMCHQWEHLSNDDDNDNEEQQQEHDLNTLSDQLIEQLTISFFENDPYFPNPKGETNVEHSLWDAFQGSYLRKSDEILQVRAATQEDEQWGDMRDFPSRFIWRCQTGEEQMDGNSPASQTEEWRVGSGCSAEQTRRNTWHHEGNRHQMHYGLGISRSIDEVVRRA